MPPGHTPWLLCVYVVHVLSKVGRADIIVVFTNNTQDRHPFKDKESDQFQNSFFQYQYKGLLRIPVPHNACSEVEKPGGNNYIALVDLSGCGVKQKVNQVHRAGYIVALVKSSDDTLLRITDKPLTIYTASVTKTTGNILEKEYLYDSGYFVYITPNFIPNWGQYLVPFLAIIGVSLVLMMIFMIAKYYRQRIRERRNRLSPRNLRKIPTKKFAEGDEYDVCAICLEDYKVGEKLRILPCDHAYHSKCVDPWLTEGKRTCPVCKRPVFVDKGKGTRTSISEDNLEGGSANERTPLIPPVSVAPTPPPSNLVEVT